MPFLFAVFPTAKAFSVSVSPFYWVVTRYENEGNSRQQGHRVQAYLLATSGRISLPQDWADLLPAATRIPFLVDLWWTHSASGLFGVLGSVVVSALVHHRRAGFRTLPGSERIPETGDRASGGSEVALAGDAVG